MEHVRWEFVWLAMNQNKLTRSTVIQMYTLKLKLVVSYSVSRTPRLMLFSAVANALMCTKQNLNAGDVHRPMMSHCVDGVLAIVRLFLHTEPGHPLVPHLRAVLHRAGWCWHLLD